MTAGDIPNRPRSALERCHPLPGTSHGAVRATHILAAVHAAAAAESLSGIVGPIPPRRAGAGLAARRRRAVRGHRLRSPAAGWCRPAIVARELDIRLIETVCVASYSHYTSRASCRCSRTWRRQHRRDRRRRGQGRADRRRPGRHRQDRASVVRELLPEAHFATVYAKPMGRPLVDTFITEVSQDTWIFFPGTPGSPSSRRSAEAGHKAGGRRSRGESSPLVAIQHTKPAPEPAGRRKPMLTRRDVLATRVSRYCWLVRGQGARAELSDPAGPHSGRLSGRWRRRHRRRGCLPSR